MESIKIKICAHNLHKVVLPALILYLESKVLKTVEQFSIVFVPYINILYHSWYFTIYTQCTFNNGMLISC